MEALISFLHSIVQLPPELELILRKELKKLMPRKYGHLLRVNEVCNKVYFIEKGLFRVYKYQNGREINRWLQIEGGVMYAVESFLTGAVTEEGIQSLEKGIVYYIRKPLHDKLLRKFPEYARINEILTREYRIQESIKEPVLLVDRYKKFLEHYGHLEERIPDKHIALFLNTAPSTFSKMKNGDTDLG